MAKPANSIAMIKLPGDTDARPIIPYALGYNSSNNYQATLPELSKDEVLGFAEDSVHTVTGLSTVAGSGTSGSYKSVRWYAANVGGITTPYDGMKIMVKVPLAGVATAGVILSINGNTDADYHPVAYNLNTALTTHYAVNTYKIFVYDATATMACYKTSNTKVTVTGVWKGESNYDSNSDTKVRQYQYNAATTALTGTKYSLLTRYDQADKAGTYIANYARFYTNAYLDVSNGYLYAPAFYENGTSLADKYLGKTAKAADADKLDGNDSTYYLNYNNLTNKPSIPDDSNLVHRTGDEPISGVKTFDSIYLGYSGSLTTGGSTGLKIDSSNNTIYGWGDGVHTFKLDATQAVLTLGSEGTGVSSYGTNTKYGLSNIIRTIKPIGTATATTYTYTFPSQSGTLGLQIDIVDLTSL